MATIYWSDGTVSCDRDYKPKQTNGRRVGSDSYKQINSVYSKGAWVTPPISKIELTAILGADSMVLESNKEHL